MNFLRNIDDERSDEEVEDVFAGADERLNDDMAANVPNVGRERAALPNIPVPRNGGVSYQQPWTGGSRAPITRVLTPKTGLCYRTLALQKTVFSRCKEGIDDAWVIKSKSTVSLSSSSVNIKDGMTALGMDLVSDVHTRRGQVNLFNSPNAISVNEIRAHEQQLGQDCEYDKQNLYYSRVFLENSIEVSLQQQIITVLRDGDSAPTLWHIIQKTLHGAATAKMIKAQKIILMRQSSQMFPVWMWVNIMKW